jgi:hypothetical protein
MRERKESVGRPVEIMWVEVAGKASDAAAAFAWTKAAKEADDAVDADDGDDGATGRVVMGGMDKAGNTGFEEADAANEEIDAEEEEKEAAADGAPAENVNAPIRAAVAEGESTTLSPSGTGENTRGPERGPTGVCLLRRLYPFDELSAWEQDCNAASSPAAEIPALRRLFLALSVTEAEVLVVRSEPMTSKRFDTGNGAVAT